MYRSPRFVRSWPCGAISSKKGKVEHVDIASIVYCYESHTRDTEYSYRGCVDKGLKYFNIKDREGLVEYLTNDRATSLVIESGPPLS